MRGKVLVVDDSSTIRLLVKRTLEAAGFEVVEAKDGALGAEIIVNAAEGELFAVISDINMPKMDGLEFLEAARRDGRSLPRFLFLTSDAGPELIARAKQHGASGWLMKPFKPEALVAAILR